LHDNDLVAGQSQYVKELRAGGLGVEEAKKGNPYQVSTIGWRPSCQCPDNEPVPATVLDPFSGAGTTCLVAAKMGRNSIGIEIKPEYVKMSKNRIKRDMGMLAEVEDG
jgi:hypothetical protein